MNLTEIKKNIENQLSRELKQGSQRNIVFWYDEDGSFVDEIDNLKLDNGEIIKLYHNNMFATKLYIEEVNTTGNLLVYSPEPRPCSKENWLTDTILYSQTYSTDFASQILLNLGIDSSLLFVVKRYTAFFKNAERIRKFEDYGIENYTELKIDVAVLSVLCKLHISNFDNVIKELLVEYSSGKSKMLDNIYKFGDKETLWKLISHNYGYNLEDKSIENLSTFLLISHLSINMEISKSTDLSKYISSNTNSFVFVDNFMKDSKGYNAYSFIAKKVADKVNLSRLIEKSDITDLIESDTFEDFDTCIIDELVKKLDLGLTYYANYITLINNRRNKRYYLEFENEYGCLLASCSFFKLCLSYENLDGATTTELFESYTKSYYQIDFYYRKFIQCYDEIKELSKFQNLFERIENKYTNWYMSELSIKWSNLINNSKWQVSGVTTQNEFFNKYVKKYIFDKERIVVIISDALRYESATELVKIINAEHNGKVELESMLGVIPSYTKLGMAALLPNREISINDKADILVDGISSQGTSNREKILNKTNVESVAIDYKNLVSMTKQEMHDKFKGVKLIYIYHDVIDSTGDKPSSERRVFAETMTAFKELTNIIRTLKNNISAVNILITADHGYIYRRSDLNESDKTPIEFKNAIEAKRRFILTKENIEIKGTDKFCLDYLNINAFIPKACNCFKVQGAGTCFVHGGTSLQEVVIPVIKFKSHKNSSIALNPKNVSLSITNLSRKITSHITSLSFFQNEIVDEKVFSLKAIAYFEDKYGTRISNENIIIAESNSINPEDRIYKKDFRLKNIYYNKNDEYFLVIKDMNILVTYPLLKVSFSIDLLK